MLPRQRENNKMTEDEIKRKEGNMFHRRERERWRLRWKERGSMCLL